MKKEIRKYLFEIVVIFIGITMSFLFESWRSNREEQQETKKQLTLLGNDLSRTTAWIEQIDSSYRKTIVDITRFRNGEEFIEEDFSVLMFRIFDNSIDFPLRDLSPYLNQVSRPGEISSISESDKIITRVAYIQTAVREDYELSKTISDYSDNNIWQKLNRDNFLSKVLDAEKSWTDSTIVWTEKRYSIAMFPDLATDLTLIELKLRKIIILHEALKNQIERLKEELSKVQ